MKYLVSGVPITFTNTSVQKENVNHWEWALSLDGVTYGAPVSTDENPVITFNSGTYPPGTLVYVRQRAIGSWGDPVDKVTQYMMVEDIDPPIIVPPTLPVNFDMGIPTDYWFTVQAGTGAGDLTWSVISNIGDLCTMEAATGKLTVSAIYNTMTVARIKVVDALSRESYYDILKPTSNVGIETWFDASMGITKDDSNRISEWKSKAALAKAGLGTFTQPTSANQPLWVDAVYSGRPTVRFDSAIKLLSLNYTAAAASYGITAVLRVIAAPTSTLNVFVNASATTVSIAPGVWQNYATPRLAAEFPSPLLIVSLLPRVSGGYNWNFVQDGYIRMVSDFCISSLYYGIRYLGYSSGAAQFDICDLITWYGGYALDTSPTLKIEWVNKVHEILGAKYNIPVKHIESYTAVGG